MNIERYNELTSQWLRETTHQRLGQYLMNHLEGPHVDDEVFYHKNTKTAANLFYERYVIKE